MIQETDPDSYLQVVLITAKCAACVTSNSSSKHPHETPLHTRTVVEQRQKVRAARKAYVASSTRQCWRCHGKGSGKCHGIGRARCCDGRRSTFTPYSNTQRQNGKITAATMYSSRSHKHTEMVSAASAPAPASECWYGTLYYMPGNKPLFARQCRSNKWVLQEI